MNRFSAIMLTIIFLFFQFLIKNGQADKTLPATLRGQPFSTPGDLVNKPEEWLKQPIRYKEGDADSEVVILLDQNNYPGLLPLIQEYAKENQVKILVREGTCGPAAEGINRKEVDIGGSCCPVAKIDRLPGLRWRTLGIAPMAILANADDPVDQLTSNQIRDIFRGKLTHWSQLPAIGEKFDKDLRIQPVIRFHCKTRPGHWRLILDNEELFSSRSNEVGSKLDMVTNVAKRRGTLGYEEDWHTINNPKFKENVKTIWVDGQNPLDPNSLKTGRYPFYFLYNVSTWTTENTLNPKAEKLVQYLMENVGRIDPAYHVIPSTELKKNGWKFKDDELIGEP
ncbi:MAG: substrate-binding domain-containing protein [Magnetococcales bacterium]|nr:substrate-binding domain-containing protein [Magnetococcales bacterium]